MPGIVGLISNMPREMAEQQLLEMVEQLRHEAFYVTGTWVDESLGVYLGWAARKGSFCDGMPHRNERGDVILVFSGEEFPQPGTAQRLKTQGHDLREPTASSYLVHLYEEDPSFPAGLNGSFHGVVIDKSRATALLFNDRYGIHRIYFHESKDTFYFAAEAKAILAVRPELRRTNPRGLGEFVACGCTLQDRSVFKALHVMPGGSAWLFQNFQLKDKRSYFRPEEWEKQETLDPQSYYERLRELFRRNLGRYFNGHQRIGVSLTGGLDTRMIMAWQNSCPGSLPCYTFGGMFRDSQDVLVAREVAHACGQPHYVLRLEEQFLPRFPHYAARAMYLTDGCIDVGRAPDLYLNEKAREIAPVRMTGNYGGELLRRVRAFKPLEPLAGLFNREFLSYVHQAKETYTELLNVHPVTFAVFRQLPWYHYGVLALDETQLSVRAPYLDNELVQTVFQAPPSALYDNRICLQLIADGNEGLLRIPTDRGLAGNRGAFWRVSSRGKLEFLFKAEYAYDMGMPQWLARLDRLFSSFHLERLFLGRHKFYHFRIWYRDHLAEYIRQMLLDSRALARPYLERKATVKVVEGHLAGDRNYTNEIHTLLTLELLHRVFIDGSGA